MIAYVYLAFWLMLSICGALLRSLVDLAGQKNFLWSRNFIARSRGIAAYRAWLPLERIRPEHVSQQAWEQQFAWPPNDKPPYLPLGQRMLRAAAVYILIWVIVLAMLQFFTPMVYVGPDGTVNLAPHREKSIATKHANQIVI